MKEVGPSKPFTMEGMGAESLGACQAGRSHLAEEKAVWGMLKCMMSLTPKTGLEGKNQATIEAALSSFGSTELIYLMLYSSSTLKPQSLGLSV